MANHDEKLQEQIDVLMSSDLYGALMQLKNYLKTRSDGQIIYHWLPDPTALDYVELSKRVTKEQEHLYQIIERGLVRRFLISFEKTFHAEGDNFKALSALKSESESHRKAHIQSMNRWAKHADELLFGNTQKATKSETNTQSPIKKTKTGTELKDKSKNEEIIVDQKSNKKKHSRQTDVQTKLSKQVEHLSNNHLESLSSLAQSYLDTNDGSVKIDRSFSDHEAVFPWKSRFRVDYAVSKAASSVQVGKIRGHVLDDSLVGFLPWLKKQFSVAGILSPHALELAFNSTKGLCKVSRQTQVEALKLLATFGIEGDYNGLAAVLHGRYVSEFALRRKQGFEKLSVIQVRNGLIDKFETGDFDEQIDSIFVETAFWYYLTKWAYYRVSTGKQADGAYLKADEAGFSLEAQRILSTIRKEQGNTQALGLQNDLAQIKQQLRYTQRQNQILRGLLGELMGHVIYQAQDQGQALDDDGKLSSENKNILSQYLLRDPVLSQYVSVIQRAAPDFGKRISEYERGER